VSGGNKTFGQNFQHPFGEENAAALGILLQDLKITSCFFIVPKFSMPIPLAMLFNSAMDIACNWLMLIVFLLESRAGRRCIVAPSSVQSASWVAGVLRTPRRHGFSSRLRQLNVLRQSSILFVPPSGAGVFLATVAIRQNGNATCGMMSGTADTFS